MARIGLSFPRSLRYLIVCFVMQFFSMFSLWSHTSDTTDFLNRYSKSYGVVIIFSVLLLVFWVVCLFAHCRMEAIVSRIPLRWYLVCVLVATLAMLVQWVLPIEPSIKVYLATNYLLMVVVSVLLRPDLLIVSRRWQTALVLVCVLMLVPMVITNLAERRFTPDEGHWADYASSSFLAGGVYARTWLQEPVVIMPGLGWSVAGYGWALENIAFDLHVGRIWNLAFYLLAFAGIAALTFRLYGRDAVIVTTAFAVLSGSFIPSWDYRPDHQLPFASTLVFFAVVQARRSSRNAAYWHFACGLLATLALQLHAAAIVFATGCALVYLVETVSNLYRRRKLDVFWPLIWFGVGAFIGTATYFVLNIYPVGGLDRFLDLLTTTREYLPDRLRYLGWVSLPEALVIASAFAYIIWRRNAADRLFLGFLSAVLLSVLCFDTQGYQTHHNALYVIPVGVLIVDGLNRFKSVQQHGLRNVLITLSITALLVGQASGTFINWSAVGDLFRTGSLPPFLYTSLQPILAPYVKDDDVVVSTHQLVWTLPDHLHLVSFAAEETAMKRWNLTDPSDVWRRVQPTLIVEIENEMHFNEGLQTYLQEYDFQICETLEVLDRAVRLYRTSCS